MVFEERKTLPVKLWLSWLLWAMLGGCGRIGVEILAVDATPAIDASADLDAIVELDTSTELDTSAPLDAETGVECVCENAHGTADCSSGRCEITCADGYADCDGRAENGCEANVSSDTLHCGGCGLACANPNGATSCVEGRCVPTCTPQAGDCDGVAQNGCEEPLSSTDNCGACEATCSNQHGTTACGDFVCAPNCEVGYASCNDNPQDGCETNTARDPNHCGDCGTTCDPDTQVCTDGVCVVSMCPSGRADCDSNRSDCETALGTVNDCGFCDDACNATNGRAACVAGSCTVSACNTGFGNCDGSYANGCEVGLGSSIAHCGRCNNPCTNAHGTVSCAQGVCAPTCATGWGSCNNNPQDGCETPLNTVTHCGMCNRACTTSLAGATPRCTDGACGVSCLNGVYAARIAVNANWSAQFIRAGSGTLVYWARLVLNQSGDALSGSVTLCGLTVPDSQNSLVNERYGATFASTVFERSIPAIPVTGTFTNGSTPSFSLDRSALLMGATLADPINGSWPSLGQLSGADHDGDGRNGVNYDYRNGSGYIYPPTTSVYFPPPARARQVDVALRLRFQLGANLTSCSAASGSASSISIEEHVLGCRIDGGGNCSSSQFQHLDTNHAQYTPQSASFSLTKLGDPGATITCAAVRAALP